MAVVQTAYAALMAVLAGYCVVLARTKSVKAGSAAAHGLIIGAILLGVLAVVYATGAFGLWRARIWGWWVSLATYVLCLALILEDIFVDQDRDPDNWIAIAILVAPILLLCGVRRFFRRPPPAQVAVP